MGIFGKLADLYQQGLGDLVGAGVSAYDKARQGRAGEAVGGILGEVAPLPVQAALYSPEAEAAFIGPKGFARLQKTGMADKAVPFKSRFFGDRWEISPSDAANVFWRMGAPTQVADMLRGKIPQGSYQSTLAKFSDFISPEQFPELAAAYPKLFQMPVQVSRSARDKTVKASYREPKIHEANVPSSFKLSGRLAKMWESKNPSPDIGDYLTDDIPVEDISNASKKFDKDFDEWYKRRFGTSENIIPTGTPQEYLGGRSFEDFDKYIQQRALDRHPGVMTVNVPDEMNAAYPGSDIAESLLHEAQHFIQREENVKGTGQTLMGLYEKAGENATAPMYRAVNAFVDSKLSPHWETNKERIRKLMEGKIKASGYRLNPYEREAFEASKRDVDPQYRQDYSRKTEKLR